MQLLFSQKIRFKNDDGSNFRNWENKQFTNVFTTIATKQYQILSSDIKEFGKFPIIDQGKEKIAGYSNNQEKLYQNKEIIVYGDHTTIIKYIDFDFIVGADGIKLLKNKFGNLKYLYYNLVFNNISPEGYKRHFSILKNIHLQIPLSKKEQEKIADFLTAIDKKIEMVGRQIDGREKFKQGLLQKMFV
jgi:type I restriction enzyme S subunit